MALRSVEARLARHLARQFATMAKDGAARPGASVAVSQTELARTIGVSRESVNKHLARLKHARVIEVAPGRVTLLAPQAVLAPGEELRAGDS